MKSGIFASLFSWKPQEAAKEEQVNLCRYCKSAKAEGAEICVHCHQWQKPKKRGLEQWLSLSGAVIGLASTVILLGISALDRLSPPKPKLAFADKAICLSDKNGVIVEVKNEGRGVGFAPWIGTHKADFQDYDVSLSLADMTRFNPYERLQLKYIPTSDLQPMPEGQDEKNCFRRIHIEPIGDTTCPCELKQ